MRATTLTMLLAIGTAATAPAQATRGTPGDFVGAPSEEYVRLLQLTGVMPRSSLMIRPTDAPMRWTAPDSARWRSPWSARYADRDIPATRQPISTRLVHPYTQATYNAGFAYGMNDGAMWAGRGTSVAQTVGGSATVGPVTLDLLPTATWSENQPFPLAPFYILQPNSSPFADQYAGLGIDRPQRFGESELSSIGPGQSAITVAAGGARLGFTARNMWWGPATENALVITNNAAGFPHVFVGTQKPVSIGIGTVEALWIGGRFWQSRYWRTGEDTMATKRWTHGVTLVFEPKGAPGMYFGATRVFMAYDRYNPVSLRELGTIFQTVRKNELTSEENPSGNDLREQMIAVSFRWLLPSGFEAYGEWGRNDHATDWRDFFVEQDHSRGFVLGAAKVFRLGDGVLSIRAEALDVASTLSHLGRATPVWYAHTRIRQGFTHQGQVIGAGAGPGAKHQSLSADWFVPQGRVGLIVQRHVHNIDGFFRAGRRDPYEHDVSLVSGPRITYFAGPVELDLRYTLQYEFNRHAIFLNDQRNHRLELRAQTWWP